jgi:hypothetical protein
VNGTFSRSLPFFARGYMDNAIAYRSGSNRAINYGSEANEMITMIQDSTSLAKAYKQDADSLWFDWLAYY